MSLTAFSNFSSSSVLSPTLSMNGVTIHNLFFCAAIHSLSSEKKTNSFGVLLFIVIAIATSSASSDREIYAFDQNPAGSDKGNEWVTLYNPSNKSVDIGNWTLENADGERETTPEGTTLSPFAYYVYTPPYQWLDNTDEAITLRDAKGEGIDSTPVVSDNENDNRYWMRNDSEWIFGLNLRG